jgi:hypothetical protein
MASQTQGIQQLLAAEKRAAEKVAEARKRKYFVYIITDTGLHFYCDGKQKSGVNRWKGV